MLPYFVAAKYRAYLGQDLSLVNRGLNKATTTNDSL